MLLKQDATIFAIIWTKQLAKILTKAFFSTASSSHSHPLVSAPSNGASGPLYKDSSAMVSWCVTWRLRAPVQSKTYCCWRGSSERIGHSSETNSKRFTPENRPKCPKGERTSSSNYWNFPGEKPCNLSLRVSTKSGCPQTHPSQMRSPNLKMPSWWLLKHRTLKKSYSSGWIW